ncbi:MAG: hypothetical protein QGH20_10295 [Candidatus Latescibacteria bacterium]|jgi:hypothetical protein|nr:hypothetical protein [Candidatus Latescibacterota bacterium]
MNEYTQSNRAVWDAWARFHVDLDFYDNDGFKAGRNTLWSIELDDCLTSPENHSCTHASSAAIYMIYPTNYTTNTTSCSHPMGSNAGCTTCPSGVG